MKTLNFIKNAMLLLTVAGLMLTGCKKDDNTSETVNTDNLKQTTKDEMALKAADDMATNDANKVLGGEGTKALLWVPCNATLDSSYVIADTVTYIILYSGLNCEGTYSRTGTVEIHKNINTRWHDAGAVVFVKFINFKITRVSDNRWVIVNGTKQFSNVSGGTLGQLGNTVTSVTHRTVGTLNGTFDDNTTRSWSIARQRVYTGTPGAIIMSMTGFGSADGYTNLESWGVNRHGDNYYRSITSAVVFKEACDRDPVAGGGVLSIPAEDITATITFGYDSNYQLVDVNGNTCATFFRVDWSRGNNSGTFYVPE